MILSYVFNCRPEWLHAFYLGKLCEKMRFSPEKALSYYSKAASLNPSGVDPVYRMHASRVKLLYKQGKENLDILQVKRMMFIYSTFLQEIAIVTLSHSQ